MATIKYLLQSESNNAPIYLRLSLGKNKSVKRKTGYFINPRNWSNSTGYPKQNDPTNKNLASMLRNLEAKIYDTLNNSDIALSEIDGNWLESAIASHTGRNEKQNLEYLLEYCSFFLNRKIKSKATQSTIKKYRTIVNKLEKYENQLGKKLLVRDVNLTFREDFKEFLSNEEKLLNNTIGRYLKFVKTICLDAAKNGISTSNQLDFFKGFTEDAPTITLSFQELQKIKEVDLDNEKLKVTRDWLIIGCYTGQRVSDLFKMTTKSIQNIQGYDFIVLRQKKTNKLVQIPIHQEVRKILNKRDGSFPFLFAKNEESNKTLFNRYLKGLCQVAEIDELVEGNLYDEEAGRTIKGLYEKYKLVSSHICRRSFATNFYGNPLYPTPILMNITAHSTERQFLEYIGKKPIDYSLQLAKIWANEN